MPGDGVGLPIAPGGKPGAEGRDGPFTPGGIGGGPEGLGAGGGMEPVGACGGPGILPGAPDPGGKKANGGGTGDILSLEVLGVYFREWTSFWLWAFVAEDALFVGVILILVARPALVVLVRLWVVVAFGSLRSGCVWDQPLAVHNIKQAAVFRLDRERQFVHVAGFASSPVFRLGFSQKHRVQHQCACLRRICIGSRR